MSEDEEYDPFECGVKEIGETEVTFSIEITESVMYHTERQNTPIVKATARYPHNRETIDFPMFAGPLFAGGSTDPTLEQIIRYHNHPNDAPTLAGIYGTPWVVLHQRPRDDYPTTDEYDWFDRAKLRDDNFEVLWDATWDETTDPRQDIRLREAQIPDDVARLTRPWDEEE